MADKSAGADALDLIADDEAVAGLLAEPKMAPQPAATPAGAIRIDFDAGYLAKLAGEIERVIPARAAGREGDGRGVLGMSGRRGSKRLQTGAAD